MPLERAQMRLRVVLSGKEARKLREKVSKLATSIESEEWDDGTLNFVSFENELKYLNLFLYLDDLCGSEIFK